MEDVLNLNATDFHYLLRNQGPSLGLWRAAEIAALREQDQAGHCRHPVLDLGCGDGMVTAMVFRCVAVGLDPDEQVVQQAATRAVYQQLVAAAVEEADLPSGTFNTIISNSVLEHIPNLDDALSAAAQLLAPGGAFIFTAPTEAFSRWLTLPAARYAAWRNQTLQHLNLLPLDMWKRHLAAAGLEIMFVRPYMRPHFVRLWDFLELLQEIWIGVGSHRKRLFSLFWQRMPDVALEWLAQKAARFNLAAPAPGGGRLILARKRTV